MKIKCKLCGTIIQGDKKGTFISCECRAIAIDETEYYARIIGREENIERIVGDNEKRRNSQ